MSNASIQKDIEALTSTVVDASSKPQLRSVIGYHLVSNFNHTYEEVEAALDEFFAKTVH